MDRRYRLRNNRDFENVYKNGKNYWNRNLVLYINKNKLGHIRVGFTVTKKIGNSVVRNKIKRRMKEIFRNNLENIIEGTGYDIILIPKKNVVDIGYDTLESAIIHILKISNVLKK